MIGFSELNYPKSHMKQMNKLDKTMFKIKLEGQEGYFLTENEYEQLKNFFNAYETKVIQNANANNS